MKTFKLLLLCVASLAVSFAAPIFTEDFSLGAVGFHTDYSLQSPLYPPETYNVGTKPTDFHNLWVDPTPTGNVGGNMMIVNGSEVVGKIVWGVDGINVTSGTNYFFEAFAANICCVPSYNVTSWANLQFEWQDASDPLNPWISLGTVNTKNAGVGVWQGLSVGSFNVGGASQINLRITNSDTAFNGNDFALDNITLDTLSKVNPVPEPSSMLMGLAGIAAIALGWKRR